MGIDFSVPTPGETTGEDYILLNLEIKFYILQLALMKEEADLALISLELVTAFP